MKTVYLCGPIQGRSDYDCNHWRDEFTKHWEALGNEVLNPMRRDYRSFEGKEDADLAEEIVTQDLDDIDASDGLVVYFDQPSVGTSMEIFYANACFGIPVVVINASGKPVSPWMLHHSNAIVHNITQAVAELDRLIPEFVIYKVERD